MKTKFFTRFRFNKEDQEKIIFVQEVDEPLFSIIENHFSEKRTLLALTDREVRDLVQKSGVTVDLLTKSLNNIFFLVMTLARNEKDDPNDLIEDIKEVYPDCVKDVTILNDRVKRIAKISKNYIELFKIKEVKEEGLPQLSRTSTTVAVKPVFTERFDFDEIDIKEYKPLKLKQTACAIIEFQNSYKKYFTFQLDSFELERLINELIALQIELKSVENERI